MSNNPSSAVELRDTRYRYAGDGRQDDRETSGASAPKAKGHRRWDDDVSLAEFRIRAVNMLKEETYHSIWYQSPGNGGKDAMVRIAHMLFHAPTIPAEVQPVVDTLRARSDAERRILQNSLDTIRRIQKEKYAGSLLELSSLPVALKSEDGEVKTHFVRFRFDRGCSEGLSEITYFLDHYGRVYTDFDDFFRSNRLPYAYAVYPKDGEMTAFDYGWTPTQQDKKWKIADFLAVLGGGAAVAVPLFVALNPAGLVIASGVGILCAVWAGGRSASELKDRSDHYQSNSGLEALPLWISVFAGGAAVGTLAPALRAVLSGEKVFEIFANASRGVAVMRGAAAVVGGIGAYTGVGSGRLPSKDEKRILAYVIFLFYNVIVTVDEANMLLIILQHDGTFKEFSQIEDPMEWQQAVLNAMGRKLLELGLPVNLFGDVRNLLVSSDFPDFAAALRRQGGLAMLAVTSCINRLSISGPR